MFEHREQRNDVCEKQLTPHDTTEQKSTEDFPLLALLLRRELKTWWFLQEKL